MARRGRSRPLGNVGPGGGGSAPGPSEEDWGDAGGYPSEDPFGGSADYQDQDSTVDQWNTYLDNAEMVDAPQD